MDRTSGIIELYPKTSNICAISVPKEKEKKGKATKVQIQEAWANHKQDKTQRNPGQCTSYSNFWKLKEIKKSWKQPEKNNSFFLNISNDRFLVRNHGGQKKVAPFFSSAKKKEYQPRILYPLKLSLRNEGEINTFSDKGTQWEFVTSRPTVKEWKFSQHKGNNKRRNFWKSEGWGWGHNRQKCR